MVLHTSDSYKARPGVRVVRKGLTDAESYNKSETQTVLTAVQTTYRQALAPQWLSQQHHQAKGGATQQLTKPSWWQQVDALTVLCCTSPAILK
jgi:hypothetical protein